jgi:putative OmpL-like beta-barrel porin-2
MRNNRMNVAAASLILISAAGTAWADDAPAAPAKPALPSIADLLTGSGITATGEVSATYDHQGFSGSNAFFPQQDSYSTFTLQQAALTVAYQPMTGFGGLVTLLAGQNIYVPNYAVSEAYSGGRSDITSTQVQLAQAYAQWIGGPLTVIAGKFTTIVGAEGLLASGNTNVTRSLLYSFEPVTHTGVRLTYAADSTLNLILGVNNGFVTSDESSARTDKTLEAGIAWTPNKMFAWTLGGYYGRDTNALGIPATQFIVDTVATWTATSALTVIASADFGQADQAYDIKGSSASWYGVAAYLNYAINDTWRVSVRAEYYDDKDGYLTLYNQNFCALGESDCEEDAIIKSPVGQNLYEGTVTFGYDPTKNIELRLEGRYDSYNGNSTLFTPSINVYQGWLEANYHF